MAIDSRAKRQSALNVSTPEYKVLPNPVNGVDQADRQHLCKLYTGVLSLTPPTAPSGLSASLV